MYQPSAVVLVLISVDGDVPGRVYISQITSNTVHTKL